MQGDDPVTDLLRDLPRAQIDDVAMRRLRQRILEYVAAPVGVAPRRHFHPWILGIPVLLAATVAAAIHLGLPDHSSHPGQQAAPQAASVFTTEGPAARWSRRVDAGTEWVDLSDGHFRVEIRSHSAARRVIVTVPDGQIEDLGTTFEVAIRGGLTTEVRVVEGRVAIHLWDRPDVVLAAGERWDRLAEPDHQEGDGPIPTGRTSAGRAGGAKAPPVTASAPAGRNQSPSADPDVDDHAIEDAAYLNVIRLLRASLPDQAGIAARAYLRRFPHAFRGEEMRELTK